jgi:hypothetical protein
MQKYYPDIMSWSTGSFEAISAFNCNLSVGDPSAKTRHFVDFRFFVPSTITPITIAVGPLPAHSFLLLGKKPQATEGDERTYDKRTHPVAEQVRAIFALGGCR